MRAVIYARFSTDNQNPDTIEVQVNKCKEYADKHGYSIANVFADEAISGMKLSRAGYQQMMHFASAGGADAVIIYDQSRMFRDMVEWFLFRREIEAIGNIRVISVTQPYVGGDLQDPAVFATEGINALVNQIHVLTTRQKVVEKMNYMAKQGQFCGGTPCLGYDVINKEYVINEEEAKVVRLIFSMTIDGASYSQIIAVLKKNGCKTKAGRDFGTNSLYSILKNEKYNGTYTYNKVKRNANGTRNTHAAPDDDRVIRVDGAVPAIVPRDTWEKVQKMLKSRVRAKRSPQSDTTAYLAGKLFCGNCGKSMVITRSKKGQYVYYDCSGKKRLKNCDKKPLPVDVAEKEVARGVKTILSEHGIDYIIDEVMEKKNAMEDTIAPKTTIIKRTLAGINTKINNINEAIAAGIFSDSTRDMLISLENEKNNLLLELANMEHIKVIAQDTREDYTSALQKFMKTDATTSDGIGAFCKWAKKIIAYDDHLEIILDLDDTSIDDYHGTKVPFSDGAADRT